VPPAAWIFDLDGTLVDTVETRIVAWLRTFEEQRIPADRALVASLIGSDGRRLARVVAEDAGQILDSDREEEIDRRAGDIYSELNLDPKTLPGALELLQALDESRRRWYAERLEEGHILLFERAPFPLPDAVERAALASARQASAAVQDWLEEQKDGGDPFPVLSKVVAERMKIAVDIMKDVNHDIEGGIIDFDTPGLPELRDATRNLHEGMKRFFRED